MSSIGIFIVEVSIGSSWLGAMVIKNPARDDQTKDLIYSDTVRYMGFSGIDDYINAYPDKCKYGARHCELLTKNNMFLITPYPSPLQTQKQTFLRCCSGISIIDRSYATPSRTIKDQFVEWLRWCAEDRYGEAFLIPMSINSVKQAYGFKTLPKKRLWFCEDWKE